MIGASKALALGSAAVLTVLYTWFGLVGLWIFGGRLNSIADAVAIYKPLLALPLFLVSVRSLRLASLLFSGYVLLTLVFYLLLDWPNLGFTLSISDWWLVVSAALLLFAWRLDERRKGQSRGNLQADRS
jgi:hypothetical protein